MTNTEKINLRIANMIFYIKKLKKKKEELCVICGKPKMAHFFRLTNKKIYCFPITKDYSKFTLNK